MLREFLYLFYLINTVYMYFLYSDIRDQNKEYDSFVDSNFGFPLTHS